MKRVTGEEENYVGDSHGNDFGFIFSNQAFKILGKISVRSYNHFEVVLFTVQSDNGYRNLFS